MAGDTQVDDPNTPKRAPGSWLPSCIAMGVAIGAATHHVAVGLAIGVAVGVALDAAKRRKAGSENDKDGDR